MKRRLLLLLPLVGFLLLALFFYRGLALDPSHRDSALMARDFPAFDLATLEEPERRVDTSLLEGEVTLVNVWGEWCPACKQEMPQLLSLAEQGIRMVGINYRDTREKGLQFLDEFGTRLVNTKSTTWRGLSVWLRESEADAQIRAHPTLMKRPVIRDDVGKLHLGWDDDVQAALL